MKNRAEIAPVGTAIRREMADGSDRLSLVGEYRSHIAKAPESKTQKSNHIDKIYMATRISMCNRPGTWLLKSRLLTPC